MKEQLRALKDIEPDFSDIPETTGMNLSNTFTGKFYRPRKKQVTVRFDMDVLEWFKHASNKYQTLMNLACREYMMRHQPKKRTP